MTRYKTTFCVGSPLTITEFRKHLHSALKQVQYTALDEKSFHVVRVKTPQRQAKSVEVLNA